jgi:hypothetical protein
VAYEDEQVILLDRALAAGVAVIGRLGNDRVGDLRGYLRQALLDEVPEPGHIPGEDGVAAVDRAPIARQGQRCLYQLEPPGLHLCECLAQKFAAGPLETRRIPLGRHASAPGLNDRPIETPNTHGQATVGKLYTQHAAILT